MLKTRDVSVCCRPITEKVKGTAVKPGYGRGPPVDQQGCQGTLSSSNWLCLVVLASGEPHKEKKKNVISPWSM